MDIEITGMDELIDSINKAVNLYPDLAEKRLKQSGNALRKKARDITMSETRSTKNSKVIKGYKVSKVRGFGTNMEVDFYNNHPVFHLLEHGHDKILPYTRGKKKLKNGGKKVGFTNGYHMVEKASAQFEPEHQERMIKMSNEILKGSGLI